MLCRRCFVSGRVQGVFYRGSTQQIAQTLGVTGSAVNLPDGRVEVTACGEPDALKRLERWLWQGSEWADVSSVECEMVEMESPSGFLTR